MNELDSQSHWNNVYRRRRADQVSWYRPHLEISLQLIGEALPGGKGRIIDVGGGESTLVDDLLAMGYGAVDVLDLSETALQVAQQRLGASASRVRWLCGDVTVYPLEPASFDLWHDRAVFHFLTRSEDRVAYVRQVARAVKPGGHVLVAAFGPHGPTRCSGLEVVRYSAAALHAEFGVEFQMLKHLTEVHRTPAGAEQQFVYCLCKVAQRNTASPSR
jgi:SAM-dependent methyltransferase